MTYDIYGTILVDPTVTVQRFEKEVEPFCACIDINVSDQNDGVSIRLTDTQTEPDGLSDNDLMNWALIQLQQFEVN